MSSTEDKTLDVPLGVEEQKSLGSVSGYVYRAYLSAGGNFCVIFVVFFLFIFAQFAASAGDYFITFWYVTFLFYNIASYFHFSNNI